MIELALYLLILSPLFIDATRRAPMACFVRRNRS